MSGWRLPSGGRIDRSRAVTFRWSGRELRGFAGDTLASALLANGIGIVGRSFKYHRPRGLIAAGLEEPNAIIQLEEGAETIPNLKATQVELYEGLKAAPVNSRPSAEFDLMAVNNIFKRFIPAAFYYKTFMWPNWHWYEPAIRRAAGLGVAPAAPDPDTYEHRFAHTDVLVVGGGAAGLSAAVAAAEGGARVMLVETDAELGGGLLGSASLVEGKPPAAWLSEMQGWLEALPNVTILRRAMASGFYDHELLSVYERLTNHVHPAARSGVRERLWKVRAGRVILATGAFERPFAFANNDLPGVMLASAAQTYALRYGAAPGRRVVVATNNDSAYAAAYALQEAGVTIEAILDSRPAGEQAGEAAARGIAVLNGSVPLKAKGRRAVKGLVAGPVSGSGSTRSFTCDSVLVSGGWNPAVHLHSQSGGRLAFDSALQAFLPGDGAQAAVNVGAAAGIFDREAALASARAAGRGGESVAAGAGPKVGPARSYSDGDAEAAKAWLDFQNDVTVADVQLAARENFRSVEHVKRYTTLGMASDQGKTSNVSAIQVLSGLLDKAPDAIGTTKFRPPFDPVTIGVLAGRAVNENLAPSAYTAAYQAHVAAGAEMEHYGGWLRAAYYRRDGEGEHEAVAREVLAVRRGVGLFDASPLGKIEVKGPDAAEFLDRIYVNNVPSLKQGRCRYGLMLSEHGVVHDDGVFARVGEEHYLVGTTSGHAASIAETLQEWLQCEWPYLRAVVENVTTCWAVMNLAGPRARDVLAAVGTDISLSAEAFPHMCYREGHVAGVPARVQRVSFTGELSYEISVPWGYGTGLWGALLNVGEPFGIMPFGIESLMVMRIEKGFLHVGSDTDGTTLPQDVGFGGVIAKKPGDFVGRRSTMRPDGLRTDRRQLVGIEITDGGAALNAGAHVLPADATMARGTDGWVTSAAFSPTLSRPLAMGLVRDGIRRIGEPVKIWDLGAWRDARIVDPRFYDKTGERLNG